MKMLSVVATMVVALVALAAPVHAVAGPPIQVPAAQPPSTTQPPPAPARLPFPPGAIHAFVDLQRVASESIDGQAANQRVQDALDDQTKVIEGRQLELQASQQKLQQNANVMSAEAQLQLQREIERMTIDVQRMSQDAETDVGALQQTLQREFQQRLVPAIDRVAASKGLQFIFSAGDGGLIWANPALDITADIVAELDKASLQTP